ncbi:MAG: SAP domain-containing protein [Candidatus Poseidoniaceae archaeon]
MTDEASSLTVAKLKALCVINDLPTSGKKADLVERLLESGLSRDEVGLKQAESIEEVEEEVIFSLEDETTITPTPKPKAKAKPEVKQEDDVLDAEVLDADLVFDEPDEGEEEPEVFTPVAVKRQDATTLVDMIKQPKVIAVVIVALFVGAAGWWYINSELEPFTADPLRYGDTMEYTITGGDDAADRPAIMASEGFLDLVFSFLDTEEDYCRVFLDYNGRGTIAISEGGPEELLGESSQNLLGAVRTRGAYGSNDWLAVEMTNTYDLDDLEVGRSLYSSWPNEGACPDASSSPSSPGEAVLTTRRYVELREQVTMSTGFEFSATVDNKPYAGSATTFDVGGLLGSLDVFLPGVSLMLQPIELQDLFGNDVIEEGASGERLGWRWRVVGADTLGDDKAWKISATHVDIESLCLGSANMEIWAEENNPWATQQTVDVIISNDGSLQSSCSPLSEAFGDYVLPEGELELHHSFKSTKLTRGSKVLDLGKDYSIRPRANLLAIDESLQEDWAAQEGIHPPDKSEYRTHTLEKAMQCFDFIGGQASGANAALDNSGYIWRAVDDRSGTATKWNVSWVAADDTAGWVLFELSGEPTSENCTYLDKGSYDEVVSYNREAIPAVANISTVEARLSDKARYPALSGEDGIYDSNGNIYPQSRLGILVAVPGNGANDLLGQLTDTSVGATTLDLSRTWTEGVWEHTFAVAVDASDGRVVGWTKLSAVEG